MMSIYLIYAVLPTLLYKPFREHELIPEVTKPDYDPENDTWAFIYAWSDEKKLVKDFMKQHKEKYFRVIKKDSIEEFPPSKGEKNHSIWMHLKLISGRLISGVKYSDKNHKDSITYTPIILTHFEDFCIDEFDPFDDFIKWCDDHGLDIPNFRIFQKRYQEALEILYFTTFQISQFGDWTKEEDEMMAETEIAVDGMNYGLTYPSGYNIYAEKNELQIYLKLYGEILSLG